VRTGSSNGGQSPSLLTADIADTLTKTSRVEFHGAPMLARETPRAVLEGDGCP